MLGAFAERWNHKSHTFIFVVGEMTILIEEVGYMLQITPDPGKKGEPSFGVPCF